MSSRWTPGGRSGTSPLSGIMVWMASMVQSQVGANGTGFGSFIFQCWVPNSIVARISAMYCRALRPNAYKLWSFASFISNVLMQAPCHFLFQSFIFRLAGIGTWCHLANLFLTKALTLTLATTTCLATSACLTLLMCLAFLAHLAFTSDPALAPGLTFASCLALALALALGLVSFFTLLGVWMTMVRLLGNVLFCGYCTEALPDGGILWVWLWGSLSSFALVPF